jgi:CRISPR-associated protein Cas2
MLTWVIYDITDNAKREKVIRVCKSYGLYRVQKSVFLGTLNTNEIDSVALECEEKIDPDIDSVYVFPFCDDCYSKIKLLGKAFDKDLVSDKIISKFF